MIDDGVRITMTLAEYDELRAKVASLFKSGVVMKHEEIVALFPWRGPREVFVEELA